MAIPLDTAGAVTYGDPVKAASRLFPEVISVWTTDDDGVETRICTATLIEQSIAVTAAHCLASRDNPLWVMVGGNRLGEGTRIAVSTTWYHSRYSQRRIANDVGLIHLVQPANVGRLATLSPGSTVSRSSRLTLAGWGVDQNGRDLERLTKISVVLDPAGARRAFGSQFNPITTYGAGRYFGRERVYGGACNGDSGGPLYLASQAQRPKLVGVVSYGSNGCDYDAPTVFARVDYFYGALKRGLRDLRIRHSKVLSDASRFPLTATMVFDYEGSLISSWSASVSASTIPSAQITKWCFVVDGRPVKLDEVLGGGEIPLAPDNDGCFTSKGFWFGDLSSGDITFSFPFYEPGLHPIHAIVTDSLGRQLITPDIQIYKVPI